jgi:hypothetical protein
MSEFRSPLTLKDDGNGIVMVLDASLRYFSDLLGREVEVPAGFETDFASIPKFIWSVLPQHGRYDRAAVVHDFLYRTGGVQRGQADDVFREAMIVCKVVDREQRIIYWGVRLGGWLPWRNYRNGAR